MKKITFFLTAIFFYAFSSISSQEITQLEKEVDNVCSSWSSDGPGGVVGIIEDGELVFSKAYGMASLEYDVPNTTETIFNIASVSKQFTAYSMILLEQQGKLSIDDDIRKYLPEVPDFGTPITIRHLLTHTSGLRNFQNMLSMAGWRIGESMTNEDLLRFISQQKELNFPVGSEYLYCNTGYVLCTFIVERVTGRDFKDWTRDHIFKPLEMNNTGYREDLEEVHKNTATSYDSQFSGKYIQPLKYWTYMGNGNVYTTIGDLAKWINNFEEKSLGEEAGINRLQERGILVNGDTLGYALGIGVGEYRGLPRLSHGGSVGGYRSTLSYFPESKTGFVIITNFSTSNPGGKVQQIMDYYLKDKLEENNSLTASKFIQLTEAVEISNSAFDECSGTYLVQGVNVKLYREEDKLLLHAPGVMPVVNLAAASDTSFFVPQAGVSVYILKRNDEMNRIVVLRGDERLNGIQLDISLQETDQLKQYVGTYYSPELDTEYHFKLTDDKLTGNHQRKEPFEITPIQKNNLSASAFYFNDIKVIRWPDGSIQGLKVSNGRVRDLWFTKVD